MPVMTQGTQMYALDNGMVSEIECATSFSPGSSPADQVEDTYLSEANTRSYKKGLRTPGQATIALNAGPTNGNHATLSNLAESSGQTDLTFAIDWADRTDEPTVATSDDPGAVDGLSLSDTHTWYVFQGYVSDFPFDLQTNTVVQASATIQRSGQGVWVPEAQPTSR